MKTIEQIDAEVEERRKDTAFTARLAASRERHRELLEYLAKR